ncbi:MAG: Cytochrome b6 [bacterium]|nr:Cytochrome b6 [bacterium]
MTMLSAVCAGLLLVSMLSGMILSARYVPAPEHAHASLAWLITEVTGGALLFSLHGWSTTLLMGALHLLVFVDLLIGRASWSHRWTWWSGLVMLFAGLGLGFTGSLLPWTQQAYWDAVVRFELISQTPLIGPALATILRGGERIGVLTLTTYNALHVHALSGLLLLALVARLWADETGPAPPRRLDQHLAALGAAGFTLVVALWQPWTLGPAADPASTDFVARPEWWFLPLFQLRKLVSGAAEVPLLLALVGLAWFLLLLQPSFDREDAAPRVRHLLLGVRIAGLLGWVLLLLFGLQPEGTANADPPASPPPRDIQPLSAS